MVIGQWGSSACHTYCVIGFKLWSSPRTRDTYTYSRVFIRGAVTTCFYGLVLSRLGFEHPTFRLRGERSHPLRHRQDGCRWKVASRGPSRNIQSHYVLQVPATLWLKYCYGVIPIQSINFEIWKRTVNYKVSMVRPRLSLPFPDAWRKGFIDMSENLF